MSLVAPRDAAHFDRVVRAYSSELFRFAHWLAGDRHVAEDVLQEALARAWRSWNQVNDEDTRRAWLYTIVRNEFHRSARARFRPEDPFDDERLEALPDERDFTAGFDVRQALERLPPAALEPLVMQVVAGLSCEEIARALGISVSAAMTRISRARSALRRLTAEEPLERKRRTA